MGPLDFTFGLLFLGTVTGIIKMLTSAFITWSTGAAAQRAHPTHPAHQSFLLEPRSSPDHVRALETQLHDVRLQNDQLLKQLDWHNKLLDTQDRVIDRINTTHPHPTAAGAP